MLTVLHNWCLRWRMAVNIDKTNILHFRRRNVEPSTFNFMLGTSPIERVSSYKYLGVIFDDHLLFTDNALLLAESAGRALGAIRSKLRYLKECRVKTFNSLFTAGVLSICDYGAGVWGTHIFPCTEQVQYKAARYFLGAHWFAPIKFLLGDIGWWSAMNIFYNYEI